MSAAWNSQPFDLDNYTNANCLCPATSTGGRCQVGYYCPSGSHEPLACPPGAFCNTSGMCGLVISMLIYMSITDQSYKYQCIVQIYVKKLYILYYIYIIYYIFYRSNL